MTELDELTGTDLCYCLASRRSARYLTRLYERHLAPSGMTSSQFSILSMLDYRSSMTVAELASAMEMERTTLVRSIKPMKEAGWIVERSEKLGRAVLFAITPVGLRKLKRGRPMWEAAQLEFEQKVGHEAAAQLRNMAILSLA